MPDETLLLFDQALSARESAAKAKLTEVLAERARGGEGRQALLDDILRIVLDPAVADEQVGTRLREGVGLDRMRGAWETRRERLPRDHGHLAMLDASMAYLRQFVPDVLAAAPRHARERRHRRRPARRHRHRHRARAWQARASPPT